MRNRMLTVVAVLATAASCTRTPDTNPTAPSAPAPVADASGGGPIQSTSWLCGLAGVVQGNSSWIIDTADCAAPVVHSLAANAGVSPVFSPGPTNYRATVLGTTVRLEWDQSPGTYAWQIEAGSAPGLANLAVLRTAPAIVGGAATQVLDVANVPPGRYFTRVRSAPPNFADLSLPSNELEVVVGLTCAGPPAAPSGFTAAVSGSSVVLNWVAPAGTPVSSYLLEVGSSAGLSNLLVFDTGSAATSLGATAAAGTYFARLRSRNACGVSAATPDLQVVIGGGPPPPSACAVALTPSSQQVGIGGGTFDLQVSTAANCQWQAATNVPWLSFTQGAAGTGNGTLRVAAAANGGAGRSGQVSVSTSTASAATAVNQDGTTTSCSYTVNPTAFNVIAAGGTVNATVTTQAGCTWTASSNTGFISIASGSSGSGSGTVTLQVANNTGSARNGTARVSWAGGGQDLTVSQSAGASTPPTAAFSYSPDPCLLTTSGLSCTFNASASSPGSGTITGYLWEYLATSVEVTSSTYVPTEFSQCGIGSNQQVGVPVTLRVRNSANLLSSPVQTTVTVRRQGVCGF